MAFLVLAVVKLMVSHFCIFTVKFLTVLLEDSSCSHALVEFVEEERTGVVPLKQMLLLVKVCKSWKE